MAYALHAPTAATELFDGVGVSSAMEPVHTKIAHISDLHFGAASEVAVEALLRDFARTAPDMVIITGDLTQEGRKSEFEAARAFLARITTPTLIVPGNHDLPVRNLWARFVAPYDRFQHYVAGAIDPVYDDDKLTIVGLNSARRSALDVNWSFGRLSQRQIRGASDHLEAAAPQTIKIVAIHHPLVRGPGSAGSRIVGRGRQALDAFAQHGLDIALTGHVHHSSAQILETGARNIVLAQAGTATSLRTRAEPPAYNRLTAQRDHLAVATRTFCGDEFETTGCAEFVRQGADGWRRGKA